MKAISIPRNDDAPIKVGETITIRGGTDFDGSSSVVVSDNAIPAEQVRWVVQADYNKRADLLSVNRPQRSLLGAMAFAQEALEEGATEVRIRPA